MSRRIGFLITIGLATLMILAVLFIRGGQQHSQATDRPLVTAAEPSPEAVEEELPSVPAATEPAPAQAPSPQESLSLTQPTTIALPTVMRNYPTPPSPFGVIMYGSISDSAGLQEMQDAGARWVTTALYWSAIEPSKGTYAWDSTDEKLQRAQAAGMDVFVLFTRNPSWAAALPGGPVTDTQDLVDFVTVMAERYDCDGTDDAPGSPCVHYWSFYAEPDNGSLAYAERGKGYWGHNGEGYADMLSQVSPAIHGADPKARVFIGGLAYDYFEPDGPFVQTFLADTLDALAALGGADKYIDGVPFHYYPINLAWPTIREKAAEILGIMDSHGAGNLPMLCPEMGFWSSPNFGSSEERQAQWLVQTFVRGLSIDLEFMSWYKVFDAAVAESDEDLYPDRTSGLLRVDGSFKPSYFAYQTMTRELEGYRYLRPFVTSGVEGHVLGRSGSEKTVLWSQAGAANATFPYTRLRLVQLTGDETIVVDNGVGDVDGGVAGQITLALGENQPVYVERQ